MTDNGAKVSRMDYLGRFLDGVDFVAAGKKGAISEDRWLMRNYDPGFYDIVSKYIEHSDHRVRAECVLLLAENRERAALDKIRVMRRTDKEPVVLACLSYLNRLQEHDDLIPALKEELRSPDGQSFRAAVDRIGAVGRSEDIAWLRDIMGGLHDWREDLLRQALERIIARDPSLEGKKHLLLSKPVFPNEDAYSRFLDKAQDYIDVRYREKIHPRKIIGMSTYRNIVKAFQQIQVRLFNEEANREYYHPADVERHQEIMGLLSWAYADLISKEIADEKGGKSNRCPECGDEMRMHNGSWMCMQCGRRS